MIEALQIFPRIHLARGARPHLPNRKGPDGDALIQFLRMVRVPTLIVVDSLVWFEAFANAVGLRLETWQTSNTLWLAEPSGPILCMTVLVLTAIAAVLHTVLA